MAQRTAGVGQNPWGPAAFPLSRETHEGTTSRLAAVWTLELPPIDKLVLLGIANYGADTQVAVERVALFAGLSRDAVMHTLVRLVNEGYVE